MRRFDIKREFGFSINTDDAIVLDSTYDAHRHAKTAETAKVSFNTNIPMEYRERIMRSLIKMGAPVYGHQYASNSSTKQSDKDYVIQSIANGYPLTRYAYRNSAGRRVTDSYTGTHVLDTALMGPLSRYRTIIGVCDAAWKRMTRTVPLRRYLKRMGVPYQEVGDETYVSNILVNVSGHVLNYILGVGLLDTSYSRAFDYGGFRNAYKENIDRGVMSDEPTYVSTAWHSWLENEVAVLSAFSMLKTFHDNRVMYSRAWKLALMAGVDVLRFNRRCKRTSITTIRSGLRLYDPRTFIAPHAIKHWFICMPMGSGKSTLARKFPNLIVDIDEVDHLNEKVKPTRRKLREYALETGDWTPHNSFWQRLCMRLIQSFKQPRIFAVHGADLVRSLFPHAPTLCLLLPLALLRERVKVRDGPEFMDLAEMNWRHNMNFSPIKTDPDSEEMTGYNLVHVKDNLELEETVLSWYTNARNVYEDVHDDI